jgi:fucose permease
MNTLHASFSGGAVLGALLAGNLLSMGWSYSGVMLLLAALYSVALLLSLPVVFPPVESSPGEQASLGATLRLLFGKPALLALALICLLGVFGEGAAMTWSVIYLRDDLQAPALVGGIAFALFNGAMFVGRLANELLVARLGARASLLISGAATVLSSALLVATTSVWLFTLALVLLGAAVAGVVPTVLTAAGQVAPGNSGTITGGIMAVAYLSFVVGAPLIGWLAELTSLRLSFLTITVGGAALIALAWGVAREH